MIDNGKKIGTLWRESEVKRFMKEAGSFEKPPRYGSDVEINDKGTVYRIHKFGDEVYTIHEKGS